MKRKKKTKKLLNSFLFLATFFSICLSALAVKTPLYIGDELAYQQNTLILDEDDSGGNVTLQFGRTLDAYLRHTGSIFEFNDDIDLGGNEIKNFRVDNLADAPICDGDALGRLYTNTTDNNSYICDGSNWNQIDITTVALQARRSTAFAIPSTFGDVELDQADVETDTTALERNDTNTDRIDIKADGTYLITYSISYGVPAAGANTEIDSQMRLNDSSVLNGSTAKNFTFRDLLSTQFGYSQVSQSFLAELSNGDFITLQLQRSSAVSTLANLTVTVTQL